jgi:hypothetical protein
MLNNFLKNLRGAKVWRAARYAIRLASMTVEALTDREGTEANTSLEKDEMLRHASCPGTMATSIMNYPMG